MVSFRKVTPVLGLCVLGFALALGGCGKKSAPVLTPDPVTPPEDVTDNGGNDGGIKLPTEGTDTRPKTLSPVFFDYDAFSLRADARRTIEDNGNAIQANPEWAVVTLEGHCDERGTTEYNLSLGQKRADSVRSYLVQLGVPQERIQTISYGEERAFDSGHSEAAWAQNRRVHFTR